MVRRGYVAAVSAPVEEGRSRLVIIAERATGTGRVDPEPEIAAVRDKVSKRFGVDVADILLLPAGLYLALPAASWPAKPPRRLTLAAHWLGGPSDAEPTRRSVPQDWCRHSVRQPATVTRHRDGRLVLAGVRRGQWSCAHCVMQRQSPPAGDWSTAAVAVHPGLTVRSAALPGAHARQSPFEVSAGGDAGASPSTRIECGSP